MEPDYIARCIEEAHRALQRGDVREWEQIVQLTVAYIQHTQPDRLAAFRILAYHTHLFHAALAVKRKGSFRVTALTHREGLEHGQAEGEEAEGQAAPARQRVRGTGLPRGRRGKPDSSHG